VRFWGEIPIIRLKGVKQVMAPKKRVEKPYNSQEEDVKEKLEFSPSVGKLIPNGTSIGGEDE